MDRTKSKPVAGNLIRRLVHDILGKDYVALTSHVSNNKCEIYHKPTGKLVMKEARNTHMIPRLEQMGDGRRSKPSVPHRGLRVTGKDPWKERQQHHVAWLLSGINADLDALRQARPNVQVLLSPPVVGEGGLKLAETGFKALYHENGEEKVVVVSPHLEKGKKVLDPDQNAVNRIEGKMAEIMDVMEDDVVFRYRSGKMTAYTRDDRLITANNFAESA